MVNSVSVCRLQLPRQLPVQIPNTASAARSGMCMNLDRSGTYRGIYTCYTCKSVLLFSNYHSCCKHTFAWSVMQMLYINPMVHARRELTIRAQQPSSWSVHLTVVKTTVCGQFMTDNWNSYKLPHHTLIHNIICQREQPSRIHKLNEPGLNASVKLCATYVVWTVFLDY